MYAKQGIFKWSNICLKMVVKCSSRQNLKESFNVSALFTSISVPVALRIINRKFTEPTEERGLDHFFNKTCLTSKDNVIHQL